MKIGSNAIFSPRGCTYCFAVFLLSSSGLALTYFTAKVSLTATSVSYGCIFGLGIGIGYSSSLGRAMEVGVIIKIYYQADSKLIYLLRFCPWCKRDRRATIGV